MYVKKIYQQSKMALIDLIPTDLIKASIKINKLLTSIELIEEFKNNT